jgi:hypothetical protein
MVVCLVSCYRALAEVLIGKHEMCLVLSILFGLLGFGGSWVAPTLGDLFRCLLRVDRHEVGRGSSRTFLGQSVSPSLSLSLGVNFAKLSLSPRLVLDQEGDCGMVDCDTDR